MGSATGANGTAFVLRLGEGDYDSKPLERLAYIVSSKGIPSQFYKSVGSVLDRVKGNIKSNAFSEAAKVYDVRQKSISRLTTVRLGRSVDRSTADVEATITFRGHKIPLADFDVQNSVQRSPKDRHTTVRRRVMVGAVRTTFRNFDSTLSLKSRYDAFYGTNRFTGHLGIFRRKSGSNHPIEEIMALSGPEMIKNAAVAKELEAGARKTFENRIEHEITRIVNGYGL